MDNVEKQLLRILTKLGLTEYGEPDGNGLINEVKNVGYKLIEYDKKLNDTINKMHNIEESLDEINKDFNNINNKIELIHKKLEGNISINTIVNAKNIIVGVATVLTGLATIGYFLSKIITMFLQK